MWQWLQRGASPRPPPRRSVLASLLTAAVAPLASASLFRVSEVLRADEVRDHASSAKLDAHTVKKVEATLFAESNVRTPLSDALPASPRGHRATSFPSPSSSRVAAFHCTTALRNRANGSLHGPRTDGNPPKAASASDTAPSAASVSSSSSPSPPVRSQDRTAELLRTIAERGAAQRQKQELHTHHAGSPGKSSSSLYLERKRPRSPQMRINERTTSSASMTGRPFSLVAGATVGSGSNNDFLASRRDAGTTIAALSPLARLFAPPTTVQPREETQKEKKTNVPLESLPKASAAAAKEGTVVAGHAQTAAASTAWRRDVAQSHQQQEEHRNSRTQSLPLTPVHRPTKPPSRALLQKLLHTIQKEKRVPWAAIDVAHPEVAQMPLYTCRKEWHGELAVQGARALAAMEGKDRAAVAPLFLCTAPTGTGKSVLLPLYVLDAHWAGLERRLQRTLALYDALIAGNAPYIDPPTRQEVETDVECEAVRLPFSLQSQADFVRDFTDCSRLCIVVSQPTRVACLALANYVSALLGGQVASSAAGTSASLVGRRVGYAVGGQSIFLPETELIFATPGYVVNALQLQRTLTTGRVMSATDTTAPPQRVHTGLSPTVLMVDEAHCRDLETDALLAWMKLSRDTATVTGTRKLRQYHVMSATLSLAAVENYLSVPVQPSHDENTEEEQSAEGVVAAHQPVLLLSPAQQRLLRRWWRSSAQSASSSVVVCGEGEEKEEETMKLDKEWSTALRANPNVRRIALQLIESMESEDAGARYSTRGMSSSAADTPFPIGQFRKGGGGSVEEGEEDSGAETLPSHVVVSTRPYRVERFFMEDLTPQSGSFAQSRVLFDARTRQRAAAASAATAATCSSGASGGAKSSSSLPNVSSARLPLCLTEEGETLRGLLASMLTTRAASYAMFGGQARLIASFLLQLLQVARQRWVRTPSTEDTAMQAHSEGEIEGAPVTLLVFVAGISEMHMILQMLERQCERVLSPISSTSRTSHGYRTPIGTPTSTGINASPVEVLRSGGEVFSIGLLHSTAVGSPHEQILATERAGAPLRILLATNVAESSLTIANTRIVVDTCLERRFRADDRTGTVRVETSFASPSALRQRCGRAGRTGDGVVLHLAPRSYVLPPAMTQPAAIVTTFPASPPVAASLEPLAVGVVAVLLRLKFLFPNVADALAALPSPPSAADVRVALQQLADMELVLLPSTEGTKGVGACVGKSTSTAAQQLYGESSPMGSVHFDSPSTPARTLLELLDGCTFTAKGRLVASLPLPHDLGCFVYHAFQFLCVEDAVLIACAMSVPSLFLTPRVTAHRVVHQGTRNHTTSDFTWSNGSSGDQRAALSPWEAFYQRLWMQRKLAGFGTSESATVNVSGEEESGDLSEPLMLRALLCRWYAVSNVAEAAALHVRYRLNRSALRQVDSMVVQCCTRLLDLLQQEGQVQRGHFREEVNSAKGEEKAGDDGQINGLEDDFGVYVCSIPTPQEDGTVSSDKEAILSFFQQDRPVEVSEQLIRSLRRLRHAAQRRVMAGGGSAGSGHANTTTYHVLPQWHDSEGPYIRLSSAPYVPHLPSKSQQRQHRYRPRSSISSSGAAMMSLATARQNGLRMNAREAQKTGEREAEAWQQQEQQQREDAVRAHPSFVHWEEAKATEGKLFNADSARDSYSTRCTSTDVSTSAATAAPPPLHLKLRHRHSAAPLYRPPAPPPSPPPVAFLLGRVEERLCAAFVAAFGQRTMRGEDGSHRFHHRRLQRNMQALGSSVAAGNVCTFQIDVQTTSSSSPAVKLHYEDLLAAGVTAPVIEAALQPYLVGAGLEQLDLFRSHPLAVAVRFSDRGLTGLLPAGGRGSVDAALEGRRCFQKGEDHDDDGSAGPFSATMEEPRTDRAGDDLYSELKDHQDAASDHPLLQPVPLSSVTPPTTHSTLPDQTAVAPMAHRERSGVHLAPFGVSLFVAATAGTGGGSGTGSGGRFNFCGLQRVPLRLSHPSEKAKSTPLAPSKPSFRNDETQSSVTASTRTTSAPPVDRAPLSFQYLSSESSMVPSEVSWMAHYGSTRRTLSRAAVAALDLDDLFPTRPPAFSPSDVSAGGQSLMSKNGAEGGMRLSDESKESVRAATAERTILSDDVGASAAFTLTVTPPVHIRRGIIWKVFLPIPVTFPTVGDEEKQQQQLGSYFSSYGTTSRAPASSLWYCALCNHLSGSRSGFERHCRTGAHLDHLHHATVLGLSRHHLECLYGYPQEVSKEGEKGEERKRIAVDSLKRKNADHAVPLEERQRLSPAHAAFPLLSMLSTEPSSAATHSAATSNRLYTQQLHPCVVHPYSFLNALQWDAGSVLAAEAGEEQRVTRDQATPLAVAGSLVALQRVMDVIPPAHLCNAHHSLSANNTFFSTARPQGGMAAAEKKRSEAAPASVAASTLSAQHVWVLNVSARRRENRNTIMPSDGTALAHSTARPPTSLLFVLCGYLAAASPQAMVALLMNRTHAYVHAVMLHGLGVWKLPEPLCMSAYAGVLEHMSRGGSWPGLLVPVESSRHGHTQKNEEQRDGGDGVYDSVHWCLPTRCCHVSSGNTEGLDSAFAAAWPTVEATLLLTLHEYQQSQRNMVTMADFVERVLHKLRLSPFLTQMAGSLSSTTTIGASPNAADLLADFLRNGRRGQSLQELLRDVGCESATPPHALAALLEADSIPLEQNPVPSNNGEEDDEAGSTVQNRLNPDSRAASAWSRRLSYRALSAEGAVVELMFALPPALPSVLPPVDFVAQLRAFYTQRHQQRWGAQKGRCRGAVNHERAPFDGRLLF